MNLESFSRSPLLVAFATALLVGCTPPNDSGGEKEPSPGNTGGSSGGRGGDEGSGEGGKGAGGSGGAPAGGSGGMAAGGSAGAPIDPTPPDAGTPPDGDGGMGGQPATPGVPGPTDLTKHRFSKVITLDTTGSGANVSGDVNKYPVAVQLDAMNFDFAQAKPNGEDIRFATADGSLLPYSIEMWDATAQKAALWVKVDVKGNDNSQSIVMHWGNPAAASAGDSKAVFSAEDGFLGVYHLDEDGSNEPETFKDSSPTEAHLTGFNMEPGMRVAARVGMGIKLDNPGGQGKNQWMGVEGPKVETAFNASAERPISATAWAYGESFRGYYETVMSKGDTSWTLQRDYRGRMETCTWSGSYHACAITGAPPVGRWVHYMVVQTTGNLTLYVDGERAARTQSFNRTGMHGFAIAHNYQANSNAATGRREWDGIFDEVRVMGGAKDANWAKLDFQSQKEGSTFLKFGPTQMK